MERNSIANNISKGYITMSDLKFLITYIFKGSTNSCLEEIGKKLHPSGETNNNYHLNHIKKMVETVSATRSNQYNDKILSRISIQKLNRINIDLHIQISENKTSPDFYLLGPDLKFYYMYLPTHSTTGTRNSKWYPWESRNLMIHIALNLRLLEIMLFNIRIDDSYELKDIGILGLEVNFEIPDQYKYSTLINNPENIRNKMNPTKVANGQFLYGKNLISITDLNNMINSAKKYIPNIINKIYPRVIESYELSIFITSKYKYAISSWNCHARILVKDEYSVNVLIIDPWMNILPFKIRNELQIKNNTITFSLFNRTIKDQDTEGSCGFCAFSRMLYLIDKEKYTLYNAANQPIPDFYAYVTKLFYLQLCRDRI